MTEARKGGNLEESLTGIIAFALGGTLIFALAFDTLQGIMHYGLEVLIFVFVGMVMLGYGLKLIISSTK